MAAVEDLGFLGKCRVPVSFIGFEVQDLCV